MATYIFYYSYPSSRNMSRLLGSSKVTTRYQITIPDEARKMLKIKDGQVVAFVEENGKVVLKTDL